MSYTYSWASEASWDTSTTVTTAVVREDFATGWTVTKNQPSEAVLASSLAPLEAVPTIRFARSQVANLYASTGLESRLQGPSRKGLSTLAQINDYRRAEDSDGNVYYLPYSAHVVFKTPITDEDPAGNVSWLLAELLGTLFENSALSPNARINSLIRGNLLPAVLR